jgi:3-hydroxymyristoyl/3-hydroxydecanoyl-(acyl carrier protein) dehydratase
MKYERTVSVHKDHPALAGHFPGRPIVPGVLVLEEVIQTLKDQYDADLVITELPAVKLFSPLLPEESLNITVETEGPDTAAFLCRAGSRLIASGSIRFRMSDGTGFR